MERESNYRLWVRSFGFEYIRSRVRIASYSCGPRGVEERRREEVIISEWLDPLIKRRLRNQENRETYIQRISLWNIFYYPTIKPLSISTSTPILTPFPFSVSPSLYLLPNPLVHPYSFQPSLSGTQQDKNVSVQSPLLIIVELWESFWFMTSLMRGVSVVSKPTYLHTYIESISFWWFEDLWWGIGKG